MGTFLETWEKIRSSSYRIGPILYDGETRTVKGLHFPIILDLLQDRERSRIASILIFISIFVGLSCQLLLNVFSDPRIVPLSSLVVGSVQVLVKPSPFAVIGQPLTVQPSFFVANRNGNPLPGRLVALSIYYRTQEVADDIIAYTGSEPSLNTETVLPTFSPFLNGGTSNSLTAVTDSSGAATFTNVVVSSAYPSLYHFTATCEGVSISADQDLSILLTTEVSKIVYNVGPPSGGLASGAPFGSQFAPSVQVLRSDGKPLQGKYVRLLAGPQQLASTAQSSSSPSANMASKVAIISNNFIGPTDANGYVSFSPNMVMIGASWPVVYLQFMCDSVSTLWQPLSQSTSAPMVPITIQTSVASVSLLTQPPATIQEGIILSNGTSPVTIQVLDSNGRPVQNRAVFALISQNAGTVLRTFGWPNPYSTAEDIQIKTLLNATAITNTQGIATFSALRFSVRGRAAGGVFRLVFSCDGVLSPQSIPITVTSSITQVTVSYPSSASSIPLYDLAGSFYLSFDLSQNMSISALNSSSLGVFGKTIDLSSISFVQYLNNNPSTGIITSKLNVSFPSADQACLLDYQDVQNVLQDPNYYSPSSCQTAWFLLPNRQGSPAGCCSNFRYPITDMNGRLNINNSLPIIIYSAPSQVTTYFLSFSIDGVRFTSNRPVQIVNSALAPASPITCSIIQVIRQPPSSIASNVSFTAADTPIVRVIDSWGRGVPRYNLTIYVATQLGLVQGVQLLGTTPSQNLYNNPLYALSTTDQSGYASFVGVSIPFAFTGSIQLYFVGYGLSSADPGTPNLKSVCYSDFSAPSAYTTPIASLVAQPLPSVTQVNSPIDVTVCASDSAGNPVPNVQLFFFLELHPDYLQFGQSFPINNVFSGPVSLKTFVGSDADYGTGFVFGGLTLFQIGVNQQTMTWLAAQAVTNATGCIESQVYILPGAYGPYSFVPTTFGAIGSPVVTFAQSPVASLQVIQDPGNSSAVLISTQSIGSSGGSVNINPPALVLVLDANGNPVVGATVAAYISSCTNPLTCPVMGIAYLSKFNVYSQPSNGSGIAIVDTMSFESGASGLYNVTYIVSIGNQSTFGNPIPITVMGNRPLNLYNYIQGCYISTPASNPVAPGVAFYQPPALTISVPQGPTGADLYSAAGFIAAAYITPANGTISSNIIGPNLRFPTDTTGRTTLYGLTVNGNPGYYTLQIYIAGIPCIVLPASLSDPPQSVVPLVVSNEAMSVVCVGCPSTVLNVTIGQPFPFQYSVAATGSSRSYLLNKYVRAAIATGASGGALDPSSSIQLTATVPTNSVLQLIVHNVIRANMQLMLTSGASGYYSFTFSVDGVASPVTVPVYATNPISAVLITQQPPMPTNIQVPFSTQPIVRIVDSQGNGMAGVAITVSALNSNDVVLSGAVSASGLPLTSDANGYIRFTSLAVKFAPSGVYQLQFSAKGIDSAPSDYISVTNQLQSSVEELHRFQSITYFFTLFSIPLLISNSSRQNAIMILYGLMTTFYFLYLASAFVTQYLVSYTEFYVSIDPYKAILCLFFFFSSFVLLLIYLILGGFALYNRYWLKKQNRTVGFYEHKKAAAFVTVKKLTVCAARVEASVAEAAIKESWGYKARRFFWHPEQVRQYYGTKYAEILEQFRLKKKQSVAFMAPAAPPLPTIPGLAWTQIKLPLPSIPMADFTPAGDWKARFKNGCISLTIFMADYFSPLHPEIHSHFEKAQDFFYPTRLLLAIFLGLWVLICMIMAANVLGQHIVIWTEQARQSFALHKYDITNQFATSITSAVQQSSQNLKRDNGLLSNLPPLPFASESSMVSETVNQMLPGLLESAISANTQTLTAQMFGSVGDGKSTVEWFNVIFMQALHGAMVISAFVIALAFFLQAQTYRENMFQLRQGNAPFDRSKVSVGVAGVFVPLQTTHIVFGYAFQTAILTAILFVFIWEKTRNIIFEAVLNIVVILTSITFIIRIIRMILFKFWVIKDRTIILHFRVFSLIEFTMVFLGIISGILQSILRFFMAFFSFLFLYTRLDVSIMNVKMRGLDLGYSAYNAMMIVDHANNNPIVIAFVEPMIEMIKKKRSAAKRELMNALPSVSVLKSPRAQSSSALVLSPGLSNSKPVLSDPFPYFPAFPSARSGGSANGSSVAVQMEDVGANNQERRRKIARNKWAVLFTLVNNPDLHVYRKHKLAQQNGHHGKAATADESWTVPIGVHASPFARQDTTIMLRQRPVQKS